jgi:hypothetical protein
MFTDNAMLIITEEQELFLYNGSDHEYVGCLDQVTDRIWIYRDREDSPVSSSTDRDTLVSEVLGYYTYSEVFQFVGMSDDGLACYVG